MSSSYTNVIIDTSTIAGFAYGLCYGMFNGLKVGFMLTSNYESTDTITKVYTVTGCTLLGAITGGTLFGGVVNFITYFPLYRVLDLS